ncbi:MAG: hypothetical protein ABI045_02590 [Flavobacteriales bacterium]
METALEQLYKKDDIVQVDFNTKAQPIKVIEIRQEYLTIEELNRLIKIPYNNHLLKRAALFSILIGLKFSDIKISKCYGVIEPIG